MTRTDFDGDRRASVLSTRVSDRAARPDATWIAWAPPPETARQSEDHLQRAIESLAAEVDYVVTQDFWDTAPCYAVRTLATRSRGKALAQELHSLLGGTAVVLGPYTQGRLAIVLGDKASAWDCLRAVTASRDGVAGRCSRFPGQRRLTGLVSVRRLIERSAVTEVALPAGVGVSVSPDDLVDARRSLRPVFDGGRLVLTVTPGPPGILLPHTWPDLPVATTISEETR